ncbi:MAG: hypothetical protein H0W25_16820 [Acidimicrobiia bacterium]|nr:hypothetical protein [Acidimicrobiia bacterium]
MIVVDDHLALLVLAEALPVADLGDDVATTSLWYLRLVAAATGPPSDMHGPGRLGRVLGALPDPAAALERILHPAPAMLTVLHPMEFAVEMARVQREQRLNLLAAETLGAALHHDGSILVAAPNAGGPIQVAATALRIAYTVRNS